MNHDPMKKRLALLFVSLLIPSVFISCAVIQEKASDLDTTIREELDDLQRPISVSARPTPTTAAPTPFMLSTPIPAPTTSLQPVSSGVRVRGAGKVVFRSQPSALLSGNQAENRIIYQGISHDLWTAEVHPLPQALIDVLNRLP